MVSNLNHDGLMMELVVVGAGPHALSLLSKLLEPRVDPLEEIPQNTTLFRRIGCRVKPRFVQEPPAELGVSKNSDLRRFEKKAFNKVQVERRQRLLERCLVVDPHGTWMAQWGKQFGALEIPALRSPITAHPDPIDVEMLRLFAEKTNRRSMESIRIGIDRSDHFHGPFEVPSVKLFQDFCELVIERYCLKDRVHPAKVTRLEPFVIENDGKRPCFKVHMSDGKSVLARNVVLATGSQNYPLLPWWATLALERFGGYPGASKSLLHSTELIGEFQVGKNDKQKHESLLIVGGGLTAGHLALRALRSNSKTQVILVVRREICERQFDLDLQWIGMKRKNHLAKFWSCDDMETRHKILQTSKNGGSMTPEVLAALTEFKTAGRLTILENTQVVEAQWCSSLNNWCVTLDNDDRHLFDGIWCATGTNTDICSDSLFEDLFKYRDAQGKGIKVHGGLPVLTEDLRVHEDLNVFVMGNYAALRVGPGALNLTGGKAAAARISRALGMGMQSSNNVWRARNSSKMKPKCHICGHH